MNTYLIMSARGGRRRAFPIHEGRTVIGRDARCDIRVPLPFVAARHCELIRTGARLVVRDFDSDGGTSLNGRVIREAVLMEGDALSIGPVAFTVRFEKAAARPRRACRSESSLGALDDSSASSRQDEGVAAPAG